MDNEFTQTAIEGPKQFIKDGVAFMKRCTKPDRKGTFPPVFASSHGLARPEFALHYTRWTRHCGIQQHAGWTIEERLVKSINSILVERGTSSRSNSDRL